MREIKFRAWDKDAGRIILASSIKMTPICSEELDSLDKQALYFRYELMQYTGLKDKNGVEIYEGDILKWENQERPSGISDYRQDQRFVIKYDISYFLAENIKYNEQSKYYGSRYLHNLFYPLQDEIEVIGNIYENPELLK